MPDGQGAPTGSRPQLLFMHMFGATQSAAVDVHDILQAPVPHWYGVHELVVAGRHMPMPSQERGEDSVEPVQLAAPHVVPAA
jgi:hypothetical protein